MFETKQGTIKPIVYVGIINNNKLLMVNYKQAPNPAKSGWWIPAPGLEFGEDPQERAKKTVEELGLRVKAIKLKEVESFVLPGGWHLICHYVINTESTHVKNDNITAFKWVDCDELSKMADIAHGKWEMNIAKGYLQN